MIKMNAPHPLLVNGEALTEFETDELHARELESAGLAVRVSSGESETETGQLVNAGKAHDVEHSQAQALATATGQAPEPATAPAVAKPKKAK